MQTEKSETLTQTKESKNRKLSTIYDPTLYGSSSYKQPINVGVDLGAKHTGIAVTTNDKVLAKGELEVRQDVKSLLETRRIYRRSRRNRKCRYRKPRFDNRKRHENWLPPSIQCRLDNTFHWIDTFLSCTQSCVNDRSGEVRYSEDDES